MMKKIRILPLIISLALLCSCGVKYEYADQKSYYDIDYTRDSAGIRLEDNYYGYQNFDFLWNNTIPADMYEYSYGALVGKQTDNVLTNEITNIINSENDFPEGSYEQKIKDLYIMYIDTEARNSSGLKPLKKGIEQIDKVRSVEEFTKVCGEIYTTYGCEILPAPYFSQDHYDSSRYSAAIGQMNLFYSADELINGKDTAEDFQENIAVILEILEYENADEYAYDIVTLLLEIAESTSDMTDISVEKLYNIYNGEELSKALNTENFIGIYDFGSTESFIVYDPVQLKKIGACLTEENLSVWKALAKCMLIYTYKDYLPDEYLKKLNSTDNRTVEEKAIAIIKQELTGEVGNIYSADNCDKETLTAVETMTKDIRNAYRNCIENSKLLSDSDRRECLEKINNITFNIGYPKEAYRSDSQISDGLLESVISIRSSIVRENLALEGKTPLPTDWNMTPQTFNAVYSCVNNSVTVPMAMFCAPFFDIEADYYTNLGGLGSIIAHEIGHAFDSQGILYDEKGNYRPERIGKNRTVGISSAVESYFGSRMIMDTFYIDGKLTAGENAADLGGMQVITSMTDNEDALRLVFESYAKIWATLGVDTDAAQQIISDVHSPAEIRVNAVLSSVDKFYDVYSIAESDRMYVPADKRVRVW